LDATAEERKAKFVKNEAIKRFKSGTSVINCNDFCAFMCVLPRVLTVCIMGLENRQI